VKINLPTKNNSKKLITLSLLGLAIKKVESGQAFKNCLDEGYKDFTLYNSLIKFPFFQNSEITNGEVLTLCCDSVKCSPEIS